MNKDNFYEELLDDSLVDDEVDEIGDGLDEGIDDSFSEQADSQTESSRRRNDQRKKDKRGDNQSKNPSKKGQGNPESAKKPLNGNDGISKGGNLPKDPGVAKATGANPSAATKGASNAASVGNKAAANGAKKAATEGAKKGGSAAAKSAGSKTGKNVAKATGAALRRIGTGILSLLAKIPPNAWPYIIAAIAIILLLVLIVLIVIFAFGSDAGLQAGYYNSACSTMTVYASSGYDGTYDLEEYVAGVVNAEVGGFNDSVMYEVASITARTYGLKHQKNCTIEGNIYKQAFKPTGNQMIIDAVANTNGQVLLDSNGELLLTEYDALAIKEVTESDYILIQQNQELPRSWVESRFNESELKYYAEHNHGRGMSQWGAYYLSTVLGYGVNDILTYYYGSDISFSSILGVGSTTNYTVATSTGNNNQIRESLGSFLLKNGDSTANMNKNMLNNIIEAGPGTRGAVPAAVASVVGTLWEKYNVRLNYTFGGGHYISLFVGGSNIHHTSGTFYGIDPGWGTNIGNFYYSGYGPYTNYGPDCSGFVSWALYNAGFIVGVDGSDNQGNYGDKYVFSGSYVGQPGDLVHKSGHIMIIVGVSAEEQSYYIAHASSGSNGVKIDKVNYNNPGPYFGGCDIVDMTDFYNNRSKITDVDAFTNAFENGMLGWS